MIISSKPVWSISICGFLVCVLACVCVCVQANGKYVGSIQGGGSLRSSQALPEHAECKPYTRLVVRCAH